MQKKTISNKGLNILISLIHDHQHNLPIMCYWRSKGMELGFAKDPFHKWFERSSLKIYNCFSPNAIIMTTFCHSFAVLQMEQQLTCDVMLEIVITPTVF